MYSSLHLTNITPDLNYFIFSFNLLHSINLAQLFPFFLILIQCFNSFHRSIQFWSVKMSFVIFPQSISVKRDKPLSLVLLGKLSNSWAPIPLCAQSIYPPLVWQNSPSELQRLFWGGDLRLLWRTGYIYLIVSFVYIFSLVHSSTTCNDERAACSGLPTQPVPSLPWDSLL